MSARFQRLPLAAQRVMPWQNGGGTTREVAIDPPDGSLATGFRWRISVAHVEKGGPFSRLQGVDRSLWLVRGNGMRLWLESREVVLAEPFARFDFAGETRIDAALLDGPCEDCNVMTRRGEVVAQAEVVHLAANASRTVACAEQGVVLVLAGALRVPTFAQSLAEGDALRVDGDEDLPLVATEPSTVLIAAFAPARG